MCICVFLSTFFIQSHFTICDWPAFLSLISRHWLQTIHDPQQLYTMCLQSPAIYLSIVFYGFECKLIRLSDIPVRNFEQLIVVWIHWLQPTIDRSIAWLNQLQCFWKRAISEMATKKKPSQWNHNCLGKNLGTNDLESFSEWSEFDLILILAIDGL